MNKRILACGTLLVLMLVSSGVKVPANSSEPARTTWTWYKFSEGDFLSWEIIELSINQTRMGVCDDTENYSCSQALANNLTTGTQFNIEFTKDFEYNFLEADIKAFNSYFTTRINETIAPGLFATNFAVGVGMVITNFTLYDNPQDIGNLFRVLWISHVITLFNGTAYHVIEKANDKTKYIEISETEIMYVEEVEMPSYTYYVEGVQDRETGVMKSFKGSDYAASIEIALNDSEITPVSSSRPITDDSFPITFSSFALIVGLGALVIVRHVLYRYKD